MPVFPEPFEERLGFHSFDTVLSCRVDIGQDKDVGIVKSGQKILEESLGPRVTVGLENRHDSSIPAPPCRLECGHDLDRMMTIVVNDKDPLLLSFDLKPSLNPAKVTEGFLNDSERNIQFKRCGNSRQGIVNVM